MYNGNVSTNSGDVIRSSTENLLLYIGTGNIQFADAQFNFICDVLNTNGNPGKQIRYIQKMLGGISKSAAEKRNHDVEYLAENYRKSLPVPSDLAPTRKEAAFLGDLEQMAIDALLHQASLDERAARILELRKDI